MENEAIDNAGDNALMGVTKDDILATMDPAISADPERYPVLNAEGTLGVRVLSTLKNAMTDAHAFYAQLGEIEKQMRAAAPNWSVVGKNNSVSYFKVQNGREHEIHQVIDKAFQRITNSMATNMEVVQGIQQKLESSIAEAIKDPSDGGFVAELRGREIRDYARSLDAQERFGLINTLIRSGDKRGVAAIINAPAFLSGFSDEENAQNKLAAEMGFAKEAYEQLQQTKVVMRRMDDAALAIRHRVSSVKHAEDSPATKLSKALAELGGVA